MIARRTAQTLQRYRHLGQPLRFGLVGLSGVAVNTGALWCLAVALQLPLVLASVLATETAVLSNFWLNDRWTFQAHQTGSRWARLLRFNTVALGGMLLTALTLTSLVSYLGVPLLLANVLAVGGAMTWNYLANRRWTWQVGVKTPLAGGSDRTERYTMSQSSTSPRVRVTPEQRTALAAPQSGVPDTRLRRWLGLGASAGTVLLGLTWIALSRPGVWGLLGALLLTAALLVRPGVLTRQTTILLLAAAVGVTAVDYLSWRGSVIGWSAWWIGVPLFAAELFGALHTLGMQYTIWPRPEPLIRASEDPTRRSIFILIPTVNEGVAVLEPTIRGAQRARDRYLARYPHGQVTIVVCNDGRVAGTPDWQATEQLAQALGVQCVTRTVPGGAKAGNLEHARQQVGATGDALVVIFDADQIAEPEFLNETILPFADPSIGWVQTGQYYRNLDNPVARWANDQQALFYRVLCSGKASQNAAFICGTNVMLRAAALDQIGGLPQDSVTEDFAASIALHPRWRSVFLSAVLARGLGPMDLRSYFKQQDRWAVGTLSIIRSHWRQLLLPGGGLTLPQRLQYLLACTHYLAGARDLVYLIAPLLFVLVGTSAVEGADLPAFLWHFLPYWIVTQLAFWHIAWGKSGLRGIVLGFGCFPVLLGSTVTALLGRRVRFAVTAKQRSAGGTWSALLPHTAGTVGCAAALTGLAWTGGFSGPLLISGAWVAYTLLLLCGMLWLGVADRLPARWPARPAWRPAPLMLRRAAAPVLITSLLVGTLAVGREAFARPAPAFVAAQDQGRPYLGIALPYELLADRPALFAQQVGAAPSIIGRTQDIGDSFDGAWADTLVANNERPWITLLFGLPGKASLESSLPAIANGLHDDDLRRWARAVRDYGKPVYLSILPHVDRNWSVSSAVGNGGIPQDTPRAWQHVRTIFAQEQALNVAWVWSPADPAHDQIYAPPPETIDLTLLSLISYPDTEWADPAAALAAVRQRYPSTPLILEVSAAGDDARRAAWLQQVGAAVAQSQGVHALVYHEGSPSEQATAADHTQWSAVADSEVAQAMRAALRQANLRYPGSTNTVALSR